MKRQQVSPTIIDMSQTRLTEYFNSRKRAADPLEGKTYKKLKLDNEEAISQTSSVRTTRSSTKTSITAPKTVRIKSLTKSASKPTRVSSRTKHISGVNLTSHKKDEVVSSFNVTSCQPSFTIFNEDKITEKGKVSKNLFPEDEGLVKKEFPSIEIGENSRKLLREKLKSSNLTELRHKLSELHGSPLKHPVLTSPCKSSLFGLSASGSPVKHGSICSPVKRDIFSTPTKLGLPSKTEIKEFITSPSKMLQNILSSPSKIVSKVPMPSFNAPSLPLPSSYSLLNSTFSSVDLVISMLTNRHEICTFEKLQKAVKQMTKRDFNLKHLEQIKTVFPNAYMFRQETDLPCFGQGRTTNYQLTIEANFDDEDLTQPISPMKSSVKFTPAKITERKAVFQLKLLNIAKKHHDDFLTSLNITLDNDKLTKWHPQFKLQDLPEISSSQLPLPPESSKSLLAQDFLEFAKNIDPRVKKATETTALLKTNLVTKDDDKDKTEVDKSSSQNATENPIKGISSSLLDRIRAKEAQKAVKLMTVSPEEGRKKTMIDKFPELSRTLYHAFTTYKKPAIPYDDVVRTFTSYYVSQIEAENHLKLMCELLHEWVTVVKVSSGTFIKLNKSINISSVLNKIELLRKTKVS